MSSGTKAKTVVKESAAAIRGHRSRTNRRGNRRNAMIAVVIVVLIGFASVLSMPKILALLRNHRRFMPIYPALDRACSENNWMHSTEFPKIDTR